MKENSWLPQLHVFRYLLMKEKLKILNIAELARRMGRRRHWFYQRFNGNVVNGKPASFTQEERERIEKILREVQSEIDGLISFFFGGA